MDPHPLEALTRANCHAIAPRMPQQSVSIYSTPRALSDTFSSSRARSYTS